MFTLFHEYTHDVAAPCRPAIRALCPCLQAEDIARDLRGSGTG